MILGRTAVFLMMWRSGESKRGVVDELVFVGEQRLQKLAQTMDDGAPGLCPLLLQSSQGNFHRMLTFRNNPFVKLLA